MSVRFVRCVFQVTLGLTSGFPSLLSVADVEVECMLYRCLWNTQLMEIFELCSGFPPSYEIRFFFLALCVEACSAMTLVCTVGFIARVLCGIFCWHSLSVVCIITSDKTWMVNRRMHASYQARAETNALCNARILIASSLVSSIVELLYFQFSKNPRVCLFSVCTESQRVR